MPVSTLDLLERIGSTLEIQVFECVRVSSPAPFVPLPKMPKVRKPMREVGFARILEPIKALYYAPRPPPVMGAFLINPKPFLL